MPIAVHNGGAGPQLHGLRGVIATTSIPMLRMRCRFLCAQHRIDFDRKTEGQLAVEVSDVIQAVE